MKKIAYIIIISAVIGSVSFLAYKYMYLGGEDVVKKVSENDTEVTASTTVPIDLGEGIVAGMIDAEVSSTTLAKLNMATLDKSIVQPKNAVPEMFKKTETSIKGFIAKLREKPGDFGGWLDLGTYRKMIEDYIGAKEAWENAAILAPKNALPLSNIGSLYGYYLKNNVKAEEYYLASIRVEPSSGFWYYQAFNFYREVMNDPIKAKNIIEEGLKNNPYDEDLKTILNSL